MAEHREAPKNPQNPTEKSDSEYQRCGIWINPPPEYSALLLHGTPVPAPTGDIPEPVKEVLEIQKARSASAPAVPSVPAAPDSAVPNPAAPNSAASTLAVSAPAPSAQAANFFPLGDGSPGAEPAAVWPPGPHNAPNVPDGHGCCCICIPAGAKCVSHLAGGESSGYTTTYWVHLSDPTCG